MGKLKNNVMPNFIALIVLFMLVLNVYTTYAKRQREMIFKGEETETVHDFDTEFDQKKYWLKKDHRGDTLICSQRTGIYPQYYKHSQVRCYKAKKVVESIQSVKRDSRGGLLRQAADRNLKKRNALRKIQKKSVKTKKKAKKFLIRKSGLIGKK